MDDPSGTMRMRGGTSLLQRVFGARMKKKKSALVAATGCMPERRHLLEANESQTLRACGGKKKKVMLRGWQYLCRPTRWRLWEGCRAGRERKNSVRRGQGFLYGGPVRNNAHARRPERRHLLEANESQTLRACGGKKKKVMLRGWQYLCRPTRWRLWEGCRAGRERKNSVRRGQGFLYGRPVRNNAHARRACGGKKKKVMLRGWQYLCRPTRWRLWEGCRAGRERKNSVRRGQGFLYGRPVRNNAHARRPERRHLLEANESQTLTPGACGGKKKKSDASRLAVPLQTHQMATVGRMPSRTREEELHQEGSGLPVWRIRPEQCACEEVLLCCKGFLGLGYKKKKSALVAATGCMPERRHLLEANESQTLRPGRQTKLHSLRWKKKKKVMLRGWQYLCRPTRWRLWEGCRAGRERKNSVRRGQGFLYGGSVRNNAHARRPERRHLLGANESQTLRTYCGVCLHKSLRWKKKKKSDASRLAVPLQTHQMATVGRMPSRTREEKLRQEGSGLPVWRTRPEQCACEEDLLWCLSSLAPAVGKKKSDASSLAVPLQTHLMATVGRMPSRTREEKLRQEGSGLPVWRTRPEQCACEESLRWKKKKKSDASRLAVPLQTHQMATVGRMPSRTREEKLRQEGSGLPVWTTRPNNAHAR
ncbi:uncharacterized protein LOC133497131, partial [Syngnathoides biaculeatus]|uniref:uncharacterized protein LOC133497131 n=1 Tax=Syngnathoides biaculeatus TaxID=300417 RepID=UPI002ADD9B38